VLEVDAVQGLPLQFGVAEAVPFLEHQQLHHHHWIHVGSASSGGVVGVEALYDGAEGFPVYEWFNFCEFVALFLHFFVDLSE